MIDLRKNPKYLFSNVKDLLKTAFLAAGLIILVFLLPAIIKFSNKTIINIEEVSYGNITIKISQGTEIQSHFFPSYHRVTNGELEYIDGKFDNIDGVEFIQVKALEDVDLRNGFIGDSKRILSLGDSEYLNLKESQELHIYTYIKGETVGGEIITRTLKSGEINTKTFKKGILAECFNTIDDDGCIEVPKPRTKGLYKSNPGQGDRIVIIDRKNKIRMDFDYWLTVVSPKKPPQEKSSKS